jgi:hypothetical protein
MAAPLIISDNLFLASQYHLDTYGNTEVIAVNQDPLAIPGSRIAGPDLFYPCTTPPANVPYTVLLMPCDMTDPTQKWTATPVPSQPNNNLVTFTMQYDASTTDHGQLWMQCNHG